MNRRTAVKSIFIYGAAIGGVVSAYEFFKLNRKVDKEYIQSRKKLIEQLTELIIPATDTPGAREAGAGDYVARAVSENLSRKDANNFIDGLKELERLSRSKKKKDFLECSMEEQKELLQIIKAPPFYGNNKTVKKIDRKILGASFFDTLKQQTVIGYCTSELGATKGMNYDYIPGHYAGCIPLEKGQKCWATK